MSFFTPPRFNPFLGGGRQIPASTNLISHPDFWGDDKVINPMPQSFWESVTPDERSLFCNHHGLYALPTVELVERVRQIIAGRESQTIEIGAGNGGMAKALGIQATDSFQQEDKHVGQFIQRQGGATVPYGAHVARYESKEAIRKFRPKVVLACWVTHKYNPVRPHLEGNQWGVDEHWILSRCDEYIFVGADTRTHNVKPLFTDLKSGKISTHEIVSWESGPMIQSRSAGEGMLVHIRRK